MTTITVPDNNTADILIEGGSEDTYIIGDNNCGRIIIKGSFNGKIKLGQNNKADIEIEDDNEGEIIIGDGNKGDINIADVNEKDIKVGDDNEGKIKTGDDNEGDIEVGDGNKGDIDIGDVNQGDVKVGKENEGDVDVDDDNEGDIDIGDDNSGDISIGDANQGKVKVGKGNKGKIRTGNDNEDDISIGDNNKGDVLINGDNDEDISTGDNNCGDIIVTGDNNGTISAGSGNEGTFDPRGEKQGTINDPGKEPCKKFFAEYDKRFLPSSPDQVVNPRDTGALIALLALRFGAREKAAQSGADPDLTVFDAQKAQIKTIIEVFSKKQLELYKECFDNGAGGIDLDAFQTCFAAFANGELIDPDRPKGSRGGRPGEPDGSFFFLFAEFALLAVDCNVDKADWDKVLPSLLKVLEIFIQVYEPTDNRVGVSRGRARSGVRVNKERKKGLHGEYSGKLFVKLMACYKKLLKRSREQKIGKPPRPNNSIVKEVSTVSFVAPGEQYGDHFVALLNIDGSFHVSETIEFIGESVACIRSE